VNFDSSVSAIPTTFGQYTGFIYKATLNDYDWSNIYIDSNVATSLASITLVENLDLVK